TGDGVEQNFERAAYWYRKSADQGEADAQFGLGSLYEDGSGVAKDAAEAAKWYRLAAEQGDAEAQFKLAKAYCTGQGVPADPVESAVWLKKSVEQQCESALSWSCPVGASGAQSSQPSSGSSP